MTKKKDQTERVRERVGCFPVYQAPPSSSFLPLSIVVTFDLLVINIFCRELKALQLIAPLTNIHDPYGGTSRDREASVWAPTIYHVCLSGGFVLSVWQFNNVFKSPML